MAAKQNENRVRLDACGIDSDPVQLCYCRQPQDLVA